MYQFNVNFFSKEHLICILGICVLIVPKLAILIKESNKIVIFFWDNFMSFLNIP